MRKSTIRTVSIIGLALGSCSFAQAALVNLNGSSSMYVTNVTIGGTDLSNPGLITLTAPTYGTNTGDFFPLIVDGPFTFAGALNLADMSTFDILGPAATRGTYVTSQFNIVLQTADFLSIYTRGIFTPGSVEGTQSGGCATLGNTCAPTDTELRWSFTKSGNSISASGTLDTVSSLPAPGSLTLLGIGLMGWLTSRYKAGQKAA